MAEITLTYDGRNSLAKKTIEYILSLGVFKEKTEEKDEYNPEFVKEIQRRRKSGNFTEINAANVWESLS